MIARSFAGRLIASAAAAAVIALSTAGCTFLAPQATLLQNGTNIVADGVAADLGQLELRNLIAVAADDPSVAVVNITFSAINTSDKTITLSYSAPTASGQQTDSLAFTPGLKNIPNSAQQLTVSVPKGAALGGLYPVTFTAEGADSVTVQIPVLDDAGRDYLSPFVPTPAP